MKQLRDVLKYLFAIIIIYSNSSCNVSALHLFSNDVVNRPIFSALNNKLATENFILVSFEKSTTTSYVLTSAAAISLSIILMAMEGR